MQQLGEIEFWKMQGACNDFILIDNLNATRLPRRDALTPAFISRLCDRRRGVGADGIIVLEKAAVDDTECSCAWQFFNSDGSPAEMCGNGARCFARFVRLVSPSLYGADRVLAFRTLAGVVRVRDECDSSRVAVIMTAPQHVRLHFPVDVLGAAHVVHSIDTGVPHAVLLRSTADSDSHVCALGAAIRNAPSFAPRGTNVNFVQILHDQPVSTLRVRTYERGCECETLACGTGVVAAALVCALLYQLESPVHCLVRSGDSLSVYFDADFSRIELHGPAEFCFRGQTTLRN